MSEKHDCPECREFDELNAARDGWDGWNGEDVRRFAYHFKGERDDARRELARLQAIVDTRQGTPQARLKALSEYAEKNVGHSPLSAKGAEGAILEELERLQRKLAEALRKEANG